MLNDPRDQFSFHAFAIQFEKNRVRLSERNIRERHARHGNLFAFTHQNGAFRTPALVDMEGDVPAIRGDGGFRQVDIGQGVALKIDFSQGARSGIGLERVDPGTRMRLGRQATKRSEIRPDIHDDIGLGLPDAVTIGYRRLENTSPWNSQGKTKRNDQPIPQMDLLRFIKAQFARNDRRPVFAFLQDDKESLQLAQQNHWIKFLDYLHIYKTLLKQAGGLLPVATIDSLIKMEEISLILLKQQIGIIQDSGTL
jgi:hypothetical protein